MGDGQEGKLTAPIERPPSESASATAVDVEEFAKNLARMVEEGGKALAAYLKPREQGRIDGEYAEFINVVKTLGQVGQYWLKDPERALDLQLNLGKSYLDLWASAVKRTAGEKAEPIAEPDPKDKRFTDPEWSTNQFFDFLKQAYLLTVKWSNHLVKDAEGLDPHTQQKAEFYIRQIVNAIAPSNFVLTNPELLRETLTSNAENLARGMQSMTTTPSRRPDACVLRQKLDDSFLCTG
jgi:polyhydroxyalkanoate synthase